MSKIPNVTPADIEAAIAEEHYFTAAQGVAGGNLCADDEDGLIGLTTNSPLHLLTFCVLVLKNGHTVTGEAHCQDPAKFNTEIGRAEARKVAINKLWPMVVYAARETPDEPDFLAGKTACNLTDGTCEACQ